MKNQEENHFIPKPPPSFKYSSVHVKTINVSNISHNLLKSYLNGNLIISKLKLQNILIMNNFNIKANFIRIQTDQLETNLTMLKYSTIEEVNTLLITINEVLNHLHSINIPHLNLKPSNILISSFNEIFISDYNINSIRYSKDIPFSSVQYFSPEQLLDREVSYESDIWSFGCIIYYIITKKQLLEGTKIEELKSKLLHIKLESDDEDSLLSKYEYLLKLMLRIKPQNRISIKEVYEELKNINEVENVYDYNSLFVDWNKCKLYITNTVNYEICANEYNLISSNEFFIYKLIKECNENNKELLYIYVLINSILHSKEWDSLKCYCYDELNNNYYKELSMSVYKQFGMCIRLLNKGYIVDFITHIHLFKCITYLDLEKNDIFRNEELMTILCGKLPLLTNLKRLKIDYFLSFRFPNTLKYLDLLMYSIKPDEYRLDLSNQGLNYKEKEYVNDLLNHSNKVVIIIDPKE